MKSAFDPLLETLIPFRRDLHRHPELSWHEKRTAMKVCEFLDRLGIAYRRDVAKTGILADLPGPPGVPAVALRADMDALPLQEETGLEFASSVDGVMHACGHDGHTTMLLGAAMLLSQQKELPAPVRLIFQPAEETGSGAVAMIEAGALEGVGLIFGGHLDRHYEAGEIVVADGAVNASSDRFRIEIRGQGGHGARPHESIDAIVVGSLLIVALQTIVSREINPAHPSVVSVGQFLAGTAHNVIAGHAILDGTIRAQEKEVRAHLKKSIERIALSIGQLHGAGIRVEFLDGTPPLVNSKPMAELSRRAALDVVEEARIRPLPTANMGAEDFAYYLERIPGSYVRFGGRVAGRESYPAHSSRFDFDERALAFGAAYFASIARHAGATLARRP